MANRATSGSVREGLAANLPPVSRSIPLAAGRRASAAALPPAPARAAAAAPVATAVLGARNAPPAQVAEPMPAERAGVDEAASIEALVRRLLTCADEAAAEDAAFDPVGAARAPCQCGVVFDVEVDGYRYRLVRSASQSAVPPDILSPREREIARMIAQGHPNKTIAAVLEISSWTVGTYLRRIFAKLNVGSRAAMVAALSEASGFGMTYAPTDLPAREPRRPPAPPARPEWSATRPVHNAVRTGGRT